jgi:hypothetical protein
MDNLDQISNSTPVYSVREYQEGDDEQIVSLLDMVFDGWPKYDLSVPNLDHWKWKYKQRKWIDCSIAVGINKEKEIVGCSHNPFYQVKIGNIEEYIQHAMDLAVHPDYRRMGMSKKLDSALPQNYITYWSTSNPIVQNMTLYSTSKSLSNDICIYNKIDDLDAYSRKKASPKWLARAKIIKKIQKIKKRKKIASNYDVKIVNSFDKKYDKLWKKMKNNFDFSIIKNSEYLNWRYCDTRCGDFKIFQVEENGEILGYSVARINRFDPETPIGLIVEIQSSVLNSDVSDSLLEEMENFFAKENVNLSKIWAVNESIVQKMINGHGYFDSLNKVYLRFDNHERNKAKLLDLIPKIPPQRVNFHMGDVDAI